jgi:hypothetical protein
MPLELKSFRLPSEWGPEDHEDQNSPRLYLKNSIDLDLPISGGWGYSIEDCVTIDKTDPTVDQSLPFDGTKVEQTFIEKRIYAELIVFRQRGDALSGINWKQTSQLMKEIDDRKFDVINLRVSAFTDRDWEFLKADWESNNSFADNEEGKEHHLRERQLRTCFYDTQYCFDITSFYGQPVLFGKKRETTH